MFKRKTAVCSGCGKSKLIYARKLCQYCYGMDRQKVYRERQKEKIKNNLAIDKEVLHEFFKNFWESNKHRNCFECNTPLYNYKHYHLHHVIPKRYYKLYPNVDIVFNPKNIVYVCLGCHSNADHGDMKETPKIKELYNKLKQELENGNF
jgi:hypothetical protein